MVAIVTNIMMAPAKKDIYTVGDWIRMTFTCPENVYTPMEVTVSIAMYLTMETTSKVEDVIYSALMTEEFITDQKIDYLRTELEHAKAGQKPQIHIG